MSELAQFLATVGGALSAQGAGGSQGLQNFMATLARQQEAQAQRDFNSQQALQSQMFTMHRDRLQREHQDKRDADQRKHEEAMLKARQTTGEGADNDRAVNYLAQAGIFAQAQGGDALAQWQGFADSLVAGGYLPKGTVIDYSTPEGTALLKAGLTQYVGNVGADLARSSYGQTKEAVADRRDAHWQMFGTVAPSDYGSEQKVRDSSNHAVALMNVGKATDEASRIRGLIDNVKVTEQDSAESLYGRLLPIAQDYARLVETLRDMEGVYGPDESGQIVRQGDTLYTPFLTGAAPLGKDYNALRDRVADLKTLFDTKREALKAQVYAQRSIGQTGELMVNVPGWGGALDADGNPTEVDERMTYFSGPIYQRENADYKNGVNALVNLSEDEAKAQGLLPLWQQFQAATTQDGTPLYDELKYWADIQFGGTPQEQGAATEAIKGVFNLNPDRVRARAAIHRDNEADLYESAVGFDSLNLDIGYTIVSEEEIVGLRNAYGKDVKVDDGLGGQEVVRRIGDPKETIGRWAADPNSNAIDKLATAAIETTPARISPDYDPDRRPGFLPEETDYVMDKELLDHRVDMMADNLGLDNTRTRLIKDKAWSLYNSGRDFVLSDNPLAADIPTAATPRLNMYKPILEAPAGQAVTTTTSDLLSPDELQQQLDSEYAWISDSYSVDRGPQLIDNLRAAASKGSAAVTQAKSSKWNPFGAADSESVELGVQTAGNTDFSLPELLGVYTTNGGSNMFKGFLTSPGNAAGRRTTQVDNAYQTSERLSFAVQYKKQQDAAGIEVDNQVYNRLALLDAMRGQKDPHKLQLQRSSVSPEQRATLLMVRDTLRGLSYDQALAFYGDKDSTGMPFSLIEEGQDVLDPVERTRVEDFLDLSGEARALTRNQEELDRASTTVQRNRFAVYDENGEDIFKPYDEALFAALTAQNEADLAAIEEINTAWRSEDVSGDLDPILISLFGDITSSTPRMMAARITKDTEAGKALISALTGTPHDQIEDMFKTPTFQNALNEMRDAPTWEQGLDPLLRMLQKTTLARIEGKRVRTGVDVRSKADSVVRMRINEYGAQRQRTAVNIERLQEAKGRPLEVTDFNPELRDYLRQKGFTPGLDFDSVVNLVFAASLYTN